VSAAPSWRMSLRAHRDQRPFRLNVLHGSRATRLYQHAGFVFDCQDGVDVFLKLA
jgi:hypothetical protein